jgi:WD40 repeat protein
MAFASLGHAAPEPVTLKGHTGWVGGVAFAPDGDTLATASADGTVRFWDAVRGELRHTLNAHDDIVSAVAFARDRRFATASFDGTVKVWDADRKPLHTFGGARGAVLTVALSPNGRALSAGGIDGAVRTWNLDDEEPRARRQRLHGSWVNAVAYKPDGLGLASGGSDNEIRFNPEIGKLMIVRPKLAEVRSVAYSPDGKLVAAGTRYGVTAVFDVNGDPVAALKGKHTGDVWGVAFSADGKWLAAGDGDWNKPGDVVLYDTATWKEALRLPHTNEVLCVAFHPSKPLLAAGAWDKTARVWNLHDVAKGKGK